MLPILLTLWQDWIAWLILSRGIKTNEIQADNEEHATAPELLQSAKFHLHCYAYFA